MAATSPYSDVPHIASSIAASFAQDDALDTLAELKTNDAAAFARLPASKRMSLGYYLTAKAAHEAANPPRGA